MASNSPQENEQPNGPIQTNYRNTTSTLAEIVDDLNGFKDKNDNLELEVPTDVKVCRICFNLLETDSYFPINSTENLGYLEKLINMCLPKINLVLTKHPVVCHKCFKKLEEFYAFLDACMKREAQLSNYCASSEISSPIDICDFLKQSVQEAPGFVEVKQELYSNTEPHCTTESDYFEMPSDDIDVKTEAENKEFPLNETNPVKKVRKMRKTITKKLKFRVGKKHFSSDLIDAEMKCETCGQKFMSKWALDRHISVHNTENAIYSCESCNTRFKYKHSYEKHVNAHLTGAPITKPFACECGKFFNRKSKLRKHQEIHVKKEKPFGCKDCGKRFIEEKSLNSHVERVHMSEKAFSCELCGNKYTSKAGLDVHFKSHFPSEKTRPEPVLMCDICGKLFARKYSLEKHHMSHTGDKPHECDQCNMKFKERYQLTIHMRRHTGEKPFKCEVCDFKFPSKNRLGVHMRIHTGVRPFPCQLCDMAFTRNDHLIKHVRAIHTGERPFECDVCNKTFNRKDYLLKHKRVHFKRGL